MKRSIVSGVAALAVLCMLAGTSFAASTMKVNVQGILLDMNCYSAHGLMSRAHGKTCGMACMMKGLPAGILVKGHAWTLVVNSRLLAHYIGLKARVVGRSNPKTNVIIPSEILVDQHGKYTKIALK